MAKRRATADHSLKHAALRLGRAELLRAALGRMGKGVAGKDVVAAKKKCADARRLFAGSLLAVTASVRNIETRLHGEVAVVTGESVGSREASAHVERRVTVEVARILWLAQKELEKASKSEGG